MAAGCRNDENVRAEFRIELPAKCVEVFWANRIVEHLSQLFEIRNRRCLRNM